MIEVQRPKSKLRELHSLKPPTPPQVDLQPQVEVQPVFESQQEAKDPDPEEATVALALPTVEVSDQQPREVFEPDFEELLPSEEKNPSLQRYIQHHRIKTEASRDDIASKASNLDSDAASLGPYGHIKPNVRLQIDLRAPNQNHSRSYLTEPQEPETNLHVALDRERASREGRRHRTEESPRMHKSPSLHKHSARRDRPFSKHLDHQSDSIVDRPISSLRPKPEPLPKSEYRKMLEHSEQNKQLYRHVFKDGSAYADLSQVLRSQGKHVASQSPSHKKPNVRGAIGEKYTKLPVILLNDKKGARLLRAAPKNFVSNYHEAQVKSRNPAPAYSPAPRYQFHKPDWWG